MLIALIIVVFFTVSSVCAEDSEIQSVSTHNSTDAVVNEVNDNSLKMTDADEMLSETDDLNETVNGNPSKTYIELEKDYHGSYNQGNGIEINRQNVVIDGKGNTINCTGENSRMFNVDKDGIVFKNIIFAGGCSDYGGAIYTNKDLTIINCTFTDNRATDGGAIYADNVKMSLYNCTFISNHATSNGGAVAAVGEAPDDWEIFNCTFIDNVADEYGGAFYSHAEQSMGNIVNSTFIGNRASAGDAIYNYGYSGTVDRCIFINNTANSMIYGSYAEMTLSNSIIVNNYGDNLINVETPTLDNNWWGTTADDEEAPVVSGDTLTNYYVLNMALDDDSADITLNNLCDNGVIISSWDKYALPSINLTLKAKNVEVPETITLGTDGTATVEHAPAGVHEITVCYNGIELTRDVKSSFKWLKDKINSEGSEIYLEQDCIYDSTKDSSLTKGIEFAKDMTIDGQGHLIDAMGLSNIIYFDDDTSSYSLTLKNIVFANATGINGAAVYFKGNKIEIINCTFTNNKADSEGDAVYVANALSKANKITESLFGENAGSNSVVFINLDSDAKLEVDNSIFMKNAAAKDINATGNVIAEYNWWGNTDENKANISKTEGVNVTNWLFLKIDAVAAINGNAIISLNNVYNGCEVSIYNEYSLKPVTFTLGGLNATASVPAVTLDDNGQANYHFRMDRHAAALTAGYGDVITVRQLEYRLVDDGSFRALNEIIFFTNEGDVVELTHDYAYFDNDTITDGIVIPRKITINGNGHVIDAKGKTRIFMVPEGVCYVTVNNVSFSNAKASHGSVIVISHYSNYFNFSNCNFTSNVATDYGGVMDCVGDYCTIENCNFIDNSAVSKAGVIRYYHDTTAYIKNSNFMNNRVADGSSGGGVIYVDAGKVFIDKSLFINNAANDRNGSVLFTSKPATVTDSIFLNNPGSSAIYGLNVKLIDNWFGNNATDYMNLSNTANAASQTWLFLNASIETNSIPESWPADLYFRLYSYNSTSGKVSEYDNQLFENIYLTITAANGRADKSIVNLKEVFSYTPASPGRGSVTAEVENVYCTVEFDVFKRQESHITVENGTINLFVGNESEINYNLDSAYAVNDITFKSSNSSVANVSSDGIVTALGEGSAVITISFLGNENYTSSSVTVTVNVNRVKIPVNDSTVPLDKTTNTKIPIYAVNLPEDATGTLTVTIGNKIYSEKLNGGKATVKAEGMSAGNYDVTIAYSGDAKYLPVVVKTTSTVIADAKVIAEQSSVLYTDKYSVTVYGQDLKAAKNTKVIFYINGEMVAAVVTGNDGVAAFTIPSKYLPNKKYTIKATSLGKTVSKIVTIKPILTLKKVNIKKSAKKLVLTATLKKVNGKYLKGKKITFKFNGKKYAAKTNSKGVAKVTIKSGVLRKLKVGKKATYQATYLKDTVKKTVKVKK